MTNFKQRWNIKSNWQLFLIIVVFAVTGSTAALIAKPILSLVGITKQTVSLWIYYPLYILLIYPFYKILLLFYAILFGQFEFFWKIIKKMLLKMKLNSIVNFIDKNKNAFQK
jgi:hypothetical protein